jgi:hypothetical protein
MAQHLWRGVESVRLCEVCLVSQMKLGGEWHRPVSPICSGDPDDGGRRTTRRRPNAPSGAPSGTLLRVLEDA